jgi:hypothetical protein
MTDSTRERESVGDNVVLSRGVPYVSRKLGYKVQMIKLPRWAFVPLLLEGVGEDDAVARFQNVAEMFYGLVNGQ